MPAATETTDTETETVESDTEVAAEPDTDSPAESGDEQGDAEAAEPLDAYALLSA
ncbi:hypothetical protein [Streptomyces chattanoogensis]|uniref:hypothetical protein n=1 Tax=Streptomyces chattanoogensis TaxID=66876 RepID=UPI00369796FD